MPIDEQQLLLEVREAVAGMKIDLQRTRSHVERQTERVGEIRDMLQNHRARLDEHTGRLQKMETEVQTHSSWRANLIGGWRGVALVLGVLASFAALGLQLYRH